jgi:hypothetical protein
MLTVRTPTRIAQPRYRRAIRISASYLRRIPVTTGAGRGSQPRASATEDTPPTVALFPPHGATIRFRAMLRCPRGSVGFSKLLLRPLPRASPRACPFGPRRAIARTKVNTLFKPVLGLRSTATSSVAVDLDPSQSARSGDVGSILALPRGQAPRFGQGCCGSKKPFAATPASIRSLAEKRLHRYIKRTLPMRRSYIPRSHTLDNAQ